jgi:LuxR family transcriptional regulator, maltose regulon positive regulatory protein
MGDPSTRPGTVAKADAIARLSTSTLPFASVVAPAGYGKTTLLAEWAEADPRPFAWSALDDGDDDALVFLRCIAAAMHRTLGVAVVRHPCRASPGEGG